jgi:hypothetical protein
MYTKNKIKFLFFVFLVATVRKFAPPEKKKKKKEAEPSGVRTLVETLVEKEKPTYLMRLIRLIT